jgi:hypothetical protein
MEDLRRPQAGDVVHVYQRAFDPATRSFGALTGPYPATVEPQKTADFAWRANHGVSVRLHATRVLTLACHCPTGETLHSTTWRWPPGGSQQ